MFNENVSRLAWGFTVWLFMKSLPLQRYKHFKVCVQGLTWTTRRHSVPLSDHKRAHHRCVAAYIVWMFFTGKGIQCLHDKPLKVPRSRGYWENVAALHPRQLFCQDICDFSRRATTLQVPHTQPSNSLFLSSCKMFRQRYLSIIFSVLRNSTVHQATAGNSMVEDI